MSVKLQATKNYDLFETCEFNRSVLKKDELKKSMKKHGYIPAYPLHVYRNGNGKLKIKAGHHRFDTAKELGISVYYTICDDNATIFDLEKGTNPWTIHDYLDAYVRLEIPSYLAIKEFRDATGINIGQSISLLAGDSASSNNHANQFKCGTYQIGNRINADRVACIVLKCRDMKLPYATHSCFVSALSILMLVDQFDDYQFLNRLETNLFMAQRKQSTVMQYLELIEQVYNFRAHCKIALAFLAKEAAQKRSAVAKNMKPKDL